MTQRAQAWQDENNADASQAPKKSTAFKPSNANLGKAADNLMSLMNDENFHSIGPGGVAANKHSQFMMANGAPTPPGREGLPGGTLNLTNLDASMSPTPNSLLFMTRGHADASSFIKDGDYLQHHQHRADPLNGEENNDHSPGGHGPTYDYVHTPHHKQHLSAKYTNKSCGIRYRSNYNYDAQNNLSDFFDDNCENYAGPQPYHIDEDDLHLNPLEDPLTGAIRNIQLRYMNEQ